ncbi:unnamed protein product [Rangifer tarandus platyrhynchus]|uniref:Uncharacterized protein n=1 Tax=Rangifer tarandus platyrhynchus TaxID=3082113 RepID=A0ABN9A1P3_RANTA|nr:unnamed protein product [Rangifer tarandus platyrhynchus]
MGLISVQSRPSRCAGSFMNIISAKQRGPDWTGPAQGSPRQSGVNRRLTTGRKRSENRESSAWRCWGGALPDWGSAFAFHIEPGVHDLPKVSHFPRCSAKLRAREAESAWELRPPHHRPDHVLHSPRARGQEHKSDGPPLAPQPLRQRAFAVPAVCRAELRSKDSQSPVTRAPSHTHVRPVQPCRLLHPSLEEGKAVLFCLTRYSVPEIQLGVGYRGQALLQTPSPPPRSALRCGAAAHPAPPSASRAQPRPPGPWTSPCSLLLGSQAGRLLPAECCLSQARPCPPSRLPALSSGPRVPSDAPTGSGSQSPESTGQRPDLRQLCRVRPELPVGAGGPQPGSFPGAGALTADMVPTSCSQAWGPQHSPHPHWLPLTWKRSRLRQAFSRWPFLRRVARPHRLPTQAFLSRKLCRELPAGPTRISVVMGQRGLVRPRVLTAGTPKLPHGGELSPTGPAEASTSGEWCGWELLDDPGTTGLSKGCRDGEGLSGQLAEGQRGRMSVLRENSETRYKETEHDQSFFWRNACFDGEFPAASVLTLGLSFGGKGQTVTVIRTALLSPHAETPQDRLPSSQNRSFPSREPQHLVSQVLPASPLHGQTCVVLEAADQMEAVRYRELV